MQVEFTGKATTEKERIYFHLFFTVVCNILSRLFSWDLFSCDVDCWLTTELPFYETKSIERVFSWEHWWFCSSNLLRQIKKQSGNYLIVHGIPALGLHWIVNHHHRSIQRPKSFAWENMTDTTRTLVTANLTFSALIMVRNWVFLTETLIK